MSKNAVITVAILFAMFLVVIGFVLFLWGILHYSKKYGEKLRDARMARTIPDAFVLKSAKGPFAVSFLMLCLLTGTFFAFRFLLSKVVWEEFQLTIQFVLAAAFLGTILLIELAGYVFAVAGFAARKLTVDGQQLRYRNWLWRTVTFHDANITGYRTFRTTVFLVGDFLRFVDDNGKKRFAIIFLSEYSRILLSRYLEKQGIYQRIHKAKK